MALYLMIFSHFVVTVGSDSCSDIGNRKRLTKNPTETFQNREKILVSFFVDFSEYGRCKFGPTYFVRLQNILSPDMNYIHCPPAHCYFHFREPVPYSAGPKLQPTVGIESKSLLMHTTCDLRRSISFYLKSAGLECVFRSLSDRGLLRRRHLKEICATQRERRISGSMTDN